MLLPVDWTPARLQKRYKRFLADVTLPDGSCETVHCPNTGAMRDLLVKDSVVYLSHDAHVKRKYPSTWQAVQQNNTLVGVNTHLPNKLIKAALLQKLLPSFDMFDTIRAEVAETKGVRFDFLLSSPSDMCYVEVKNVHYQEKGVALFPDSPTERGVKHLKALMEKVRLGHRAALVYAVQRDDCHAFDTCHTFDPLYDATAREALEVGVEMCAYAFTLTTKGVSLKGALDVVKKKGGQKQTAPQKLGKALCV